MVSTGVVTMAEPIYFVDIKAKQEKKATVPFVLKLPRTFVLARADIFFNYLLLKEHQPFLTN